MLPWLKRNISRRSWKDKVMRKREISHRKRLDPYEIDKSEVMVLKERVYKAQRHATMQMNELENEIRKQKLEKRKE